MCAYRRPAPEGEGTGRVVPALSRPGESWSRHRMSSGVMMHSAQMMKPLRAMEMIAQNG